MPRVFASGPWDMSTHETRAMPGPAGAYAGNSLPFKQHKINEEIRLKYTVFSFSNVYWWNFSWQDLIG